MLANPESLASILERILSEVRANVKVAVREAVDETQRREVVYVSSPCGPHPPGKSARWCRDHFKAIPGACRAGTAYQLSKHDYDAWTEKCPPLKRVPARVVRGPWSAEKALELAGVRAQKIGGQR